MEGTELAPGRDPVIPPLRPRYPAIPSAFFAPRVVLDLQCLSVESSTFLSMMVYSLCMEMLACRLGLSTRWSNYGTMAVTQPFSGGVSLVYFDGLQKPLRREAVPR